ncbi:undecaprenyl-phosphate glucose phosphotransferase [Rhizobium rhizosphaerae]|uniref:Undecaprenyl-phosphate glucose phosphotransferase n=2 Tax=Xaviernesmea rhizosphaerae TaxID=1672749 RepID=A0A1Q9AN90_9HYPH|nr:undecaprenyl-phosphate glucose phosphotransferase [Xaviernesmea rhizosphaerae]
MTQTARETMTQASFPGNPDAEGSRPATQSVAAGHPAPAATGTSTLNPFALRIAEQFRSETYRPTLVPGLARLMDFLLLVAVGSGATMVLEGDSLAAWLRFAPVFTGGALLAVLFLQLADAYQRPALKGVRRTLMRLLLAWVLAFALATPTLILLPSEQGPPLRWLAAWLCGGVLMLCFGRVALSAAISRWARKGQMERRVVIIGGGEPAKGLIRALEAQRDGDIRICGIFDDRRSDRSPEIIAGYPKLGTFAELVEFCRLARVDMLIIALPLSAERRILTLLRKLWVLPIDIRLAAHANNLRFRPRNYSHIGQVAMLDIFDKPIADWDSVAKRIFDVTFTLLALMLFWPVMIAAAIAVKFSSPGPVFFKQKRHGFNNEEIEVLKFRSMYTNQADPSARRAVTRGDPRVTPIGRFLRKSSIDELPQLFNVLKGDLSLVGPRPHAVAGQTADRTYVEIVESYFARHRVKPGVTGWAQINGWRGEIDSDDKIRFRTAHDLYYIENWSLWFDLKILLLTPIRLLNTENAY